MNCVVVIVFISLAVLTSSSRVAESEFKLSNKESTEGGNRTISECLIEEKTFIVNTTEKVSWYRNYINCRHNKMEMVIIKNQKEYDRFVLAIKDKLTPSEDVGVWTSGYYDRETSKYQWMTRLTPMTFSSWRPGRPESAPSESRCVELRKSHDYKMDDVHCVTDNYGACQRLAQGSVWGQC